MNNIAKHIIWHIFFAGIPFLPFAYTSLYAENYQITVDGLYKKNIVSSPEMADMQYNCVNSIDYSTGQIDIRIPLFEVECGSLKLPIYLTYKSSGVKISDPSGWVGQNWTLHAEPSISRVPKGHLDNHYKCEFDSINTIFQAEFFTNPNLNCSFDAMPDEYYYSLPTASGMFLYSKGHTSEDSMYVCMPYDDVKIKKVDRDVFCLTDADGTRYSFGGGRETNQINCDYVSAWHGSSIVAANGIDSIAFSYGNTFQYEIERHLDHYTVVDNMSPHDAIQHWHCGLPYDQWSQEHLAFFPDIEPLLKTPIVYETFDKSTNSYYVGNNHELVRESSRIIDDLQYLPSLIIRGNRLSSINYCGNTVTFTDESVNNNSNHRRLKKITVKNCRNQIVKVINLSYYEGNSRYFLSEVSIAGGADTARYGFDYESRFDANFRNLPNCSSRDLDFWGYWTNVSRPDSVTLVPRMKLYTSVPYPSGYYYNYREDSLTIGTMIVNGSTQSRATNETYMRIGALKRITYPTGLKDIFTFEANRARINDDISYDGTSEFSIKDHLLRENVDIFQLGGLRIKEILTVEGNDTIQRRYFKYGTNEDGAGVTPVLGGINYFLRKTQKHYFYHIQAPTSELNYWGSSEYRTLSSDPVIPLTYYNGSPVMYNYVTEYNGTPSDNTGKTVYVYELPDYCSIPGMGSARIFNPRNIPDVSAFRYGVMQSDHLKEKIQYKRNTTGDYTEVERDKYTYTTNQKTTISIKGCEVNFETTGYYPDQYKYDLGQPYTRTFNTNYYTFSPLAHLLTKVEHKVTQENGTATTTTSYNYSNSHDKQLTSKTVSRDGQPAMMESYLHPQQMGEGAPYGDMTVRNILSPVIRTTCSRNGRSFYKENPYSAFTNHLGGTMYLPAGLKLKTDRMTEAETRIQYQYNRYGKLRTATKDDDEIETYIYSYNSQYPIAEIQNATWFDATMSINPSTMDQIEASANLTDAQALSLRNALNGMEAQTGGAALANLYRFEPLVGMTSYTSPTGLTTAYTYDGLNRLRTEAFKIGNAQKQIRDYAYQFQPQPSISTRTFLTDDGSDWTETISYLDGRGREKETVMPWALPDGSTLVSFNERDKFGRLFRKWNPVRFADGGSDYIELEELGNGSVQMYDDSKPYTLTVYEASPLDKVEEQYMPGAAWHTGGKSTRRQTLFNSTTTDSLRCMKYSVSQDSLKREGLYASCSLDVEVTTDEDGHTRMEFKDMLGNPVLTRSIADGGFIDTYYVRDEWGNVQAVLPPMLSDSLAQSSSTMWLLSNSLIKSYAYLYQYDERYRMTSKRIPGCEPISYTYDTADRLVAMQDGELRSSGRRRFYLYDPLGRLCIQGTTTQGIGATIMRVARTCGTAGFMNTGYDATQASGTLPSSSACELELVNYYDDNQYSFLGHYTQVDAIRRDSLDLSTTQCEQGLLVGVWQKASNGETLLTTSCYDAYGRLARQAAVSLNGNLVMSYFDYSFSGDLLDKRTFTYRSGAGGLLTRLSSEQMKNIYDFPHNKMLHQSVISIRGKDNTNCMRDTITFGYDEVGNLASMNRSGTSADMNYTYDLLHGWGKEISSTGGFQQKLYREDNANHPLYNGSISAMTWQVPGSRYMRRYDYTFDGMNRLTEGFYTQSPIAGSDSLIYHDPILGFPYLDLIPISGGGIGDPIGPIINAANRYTERISYDKNSNIEGLMRYGMNNQRQYGLIDSLFITRNGNQLKAIEDYAQKHLTYTGASDFYDGYSYNTEYYYNANGALESDINRDIDLIQYDDLGNTRCIYYFGQNQIEYVYAADGTKLRTIHRPASSSALTDSIDYIGNLILKNGQPSMYLFDGGYASFDANGAVDGWHYYIQDYMGNNRMVVNSGGAVEQVTHYYPYGGVIGDISTNENVQKYKFEGKELDRTFGLDNYDIHARQYFAMAPMWDRIDPMAEKYYGLSPYAYCGGDPINILDYDGEAWIKASYGNEEFYCYDPAIQTQEDINNKYYYGDNKNEKKITLVGETGSFEHGGRHYNLNEDGSYSYYTDNSVTSIGGETDENGLHIGQIGENQQSDNLYGNYLGDHNPRNDKGKDSYCLPPIDELDYAAFCHDKAYDAVGARGLQGVASLSTMSADLALANSCFKDNNNSRNLQITQYSQKRAFYSNGAYRLFGYIGTSKLLKKYFSIEFFFR